MAVFEVVATKTLIFLISPPPFFGGGGGGSSIGVLEKVVGLGKFFWCGGVLPLCLL